MIADAAFVKSKQTNVKTPFNMKKARAIQEFKAKLKAAETTLQMLTSESIAPDSPSPIYPENLNQPSPAAENDGLERNV